MLNGEFNTSWKCVILKPLIKKAGGPVEKTNYRQVSNLSFISKLVEKAVQDQYVKHCNRAKLNSKFQSVYKEGHICETALLKIQNDVIWAMEQVSTLGLDLSAVFKTVDHDILLDILNKKFGISGSALK